LSTTFPRDKIRELFFPHKRENWNIREDMEMSVNIVPAYDHPKEVGALFEEYTTMLVEASEGFRDYLALQHYDEELKHLEAKYGPPDGRLYLALCNGLPAGCIGLRKIDKETCEMKRLYVRPQFRGQQIGKRLVSQVIADAKEIGYAHMLLDTFPFLDHAIHIYQTCGFYEIERYNDNPLDNFVYMKLDL